MARVLVLNQYFPPDTAVTGRHAATIAARLARDGFEVTALVGEPSYAAVGEAAPRVETVDGLRVERVPMGALRGRERLLLRLSGYLRYLGGAYRRGRRHAPDVIVSFHNPPFLGLVAARLARRSGARLIYVPQDIHPDILLATGWLKLPAPVVALWERVNAHIHGTASRIVVLGEGMRRTLLAKQIHDDRVVVIPLWAEPQLDAVPPDPARRRELAGDAELVVLYAGNMGVMQPLGPLLDAADALRGEPVRFLLAGSGVRRAEVEAEVVARGLDNARMLPFQRGADYASLVAAADVCVVSLASGMELLSVPSRTFAFLAAGRPVLALMERAADIARIVEDAGAGFWVADADDLVRRLRELRADPARRAELGAAARAAYEARFTPEQVTGRYSRLVLEVLAA